MIKRLLLSLALALLCTAQSSTSQNEGIPVYPAIQFSPTTLTFPATAVGASSATQVVTATNFDYRFSHTISVSLTGTNAGDYSQTNNCPGTLNGGPPSSRGSCQITVTFTPTTTGTRTANAQVKITSNNYVYTAALTGTGVTAPPPAPNIVFTPASLTFPPVATGSSSAAQSVTAQNVSASSQAITIALTGTNSGDYSQINTCPGTLAAGASCSFSVTFTPSATGTRTANVQVTTTGDGRNYTAALTGTGSAASPSIQFTPASLNFPSTAVGSSSSSQTTTAQNISGTRQAITLTLNGTNPGDFAQTNNCPGTLNAGASCTFTVTFTPTVVGARAAQLQITTTSDGRQYPAALAGTGITGSGGGGCSTCLWGLTFDTVSSPSALNNVLTHMKDRPTTRIVFDTGQNPTSVYLTPMTTFHANSDLMGELIDSNYMTSYANAAAVTTWTNSYYSALNGVTDIWEIGNEINGNWLSNLSDGSDVMPKMEAMYDAIDAHAGTKKALTFFYEGEPSEPNNCIATDHGGNDMFTWITTNFQLGLPIGSRSAETEKIRTHLDYALISWYPDQCPGENPNWATVYTNLSAIFPNAKVGFGENGTANPQNGSSFEANEISTIYAMRPSAGGLPATFITGVFWWYAAEELSPWPGFVTGSFPSGMGPAINAQLP